jgi:hypothetical protein
MSSRRVEIVAIHRDEVLDLGVKPLRRAVRPIHPRSRMECGGEAPGADGPKCGVGWRVTADLSSTVRMRRHAVYGAQYHASDRSARHRGNPRAGMARSSRQTRKDTRALETRANAPGRGESWVADYRLLCNIADISPCIL